MISEKAAVIMDIIVPDFIEYSKNIYGFTESYFCSADEEYEILNRYELPHDRVYDCLKYLKALKGIEEYGENSDLIKKYTYLFEKTCGCISAIGFISDHMEGWQNESNSEIQMEASLISGIASLRIILNENIEELIEAYSKDSRAWKSLNISASQAVDDEIKNKSAYQVSLFELDADTNENSYAPEDDDYMDDDNDEEKVDLWNVYEYSVIYDELTRFIDFYKAKDRNNLAFLEYLEKFLKEFASEKECEGFSFSLSLREGNEIVYYDFYSDGKSIDISQGGHVHDPDVGGDSYTVWMFSLWKDGETSGELYPFADEMCELLSMGARLTISEPEEYADCEEDCEEE